MRPFGRIFLSSRELIGKGRARSSDETKLLRLLAPLVEDYDRRHFHLTSSHVQEALTGKRSLSAPHPRKLGETLSVAPGLFL